MEFFNIEIINAISTAVASVAAVAAAILSTDIKKIQNCCRATTIL